MSTRPAGTERDACALFLHAGALGDVLLTLHVVAGYRRRFPGHRIVVAARSPLAAWAASHGVIDEALALESLPTHTLYFDGPVPAGFSALLRRCGRVVSFLGDAAAPHSQRLSALTHTCHCIDPAPTSDTMQHGRHITRQWLDSLAAAGLPLEATESLSVKPSRDELTAARAELADRCGAPPGRCVIVHPGSGGRRKCCPLEPLEQFVTRLERFGCAAAWMIGPVEIERDGRELAQRLEGTAPILMSDDLARVAAWVAAAAVYVGNDAGVTHLAAALATPTVALFGPTDPRVWRPLGRAVRIVRFGESDDVATQLDEVCREWLMSNRKA